MGFLSITGIMIHAVFRCFKRDTFKILEKGVSPCSGVTITIRASPCCVFFWIIRRLSQFFFKNSTEIGDSMPNAPP